MCLPSREQVPLAVKRTLKPNFILFALGDPVTTLCCLISGSVEVVCVYVEVVCVCVSVRVCVCLPHLRVQLSVSVFVSCALPVRSCPCVAASV